MTDIKYVIALLDDMQALADLRVHEIVSPDNWDVYSDLCDLIYLAKESVLALLQEQEAIKPREQEETHTWTVCGNCSQHLISKWLWCPYCGKKVKWDD